MGIPLGQPLEKTFTPSIRLPAIGDKLDFAVINEEVVPAYIFGTKTQDTTAAGKPRTQDLLTVLVIRGTAVITETDGDGKAVLDAQGNQVTRQVREGDIGAIYVEGQTRYDPDVDKTRTKDQPRSWSAVKDDVGGQAEVGDVGRWVYEGDVQGKGTQPRKVRKFLLRRAKPEEQARVVQCEVLYRERTAIKVGAGGASVYTDEEPF